MTISRRDMIKGAAAAGAALSLPAVPLAAQTPAPAPAAYTPKFFTAAEYALVDELSDMIIPTDEQSGGARAAACAAYIDAQLAQSFDKEPPRRFRAGIQAIEALSRQTNGKAFMASTPEQRLALLTTIAANEKDPKTDAEKFFKEIKGATIHAYYTSTIGIHDDQRYKGNVYQTGEYAGFDAT
jgi:Gluconate 2-dehydrogenase subunit 3/TAT (twin-arginine translocation) pathway signal sequence